MAKQTFGAVTTHPGHGTRVIINAREHQIIADEPAELDGTNTGANPVEILLGALGSCMSVVAQVYAEKFDIQFDELKIDLEGDLDLGGFLGTADVRPGFSDVRFKYVIETDAPQEKVRAWLEHVQTHCPVGDTIANAVNTASVGFEIKARTSKAA